MNRLTAVPMDIVPIMAIDNGFCSSEPISDENSNGTIAKIVVSEVMIIGRKRLRPASWIASSKGTPALRSSLIASSFRIESLITIPQVTINPIADIRFSVCPQIQSKKSKGKCHINRDFRQYQQRLQKTLELCGKNEIHQQQ